MTIATPPIADTLGVILPCADDVLLLRVLAGPDEAIAEAWSTWRRSTTNFRQLFGTQRRDLRRLLPLLAYRLRRSGVEVDAELQHILRAAQLWEELRSQRILEILEVVLDTLSAVEISPCVVGGLATAVIGYPKLDIRHCHDIDLFVPIGLVERAETALVGAGFQPEISVNERPMVTLHHRDGLPINLHTTLVDSEFYRLPQAEMLRRVRSGRLGGREVGLFAPMDALLHRFARIATAASLKPLSAMADGALIAAAVTDDAEWDGFAADAIAARLHLQTFVIGSYLNRTIGCRVPERVLDRLAEAAARADAETIDMALHHARVVQKTSMTTMIAASGWRSRLHILRWIVLPSPRSLRDWCARRGVSWTPFWYLGRPLRRAAILVRRAMGKAPRSSPSNPNTPEA